MFRRDSAFTIVTMTAALEETTVSYEELLALENDFEDLETEMIRQHYIQSRHLYEKRQKLIENIPNFWPLVVEQAPLEIDEYIQPSDSAVLLNSLKSLSVSRFELDADEKKGEPRSFSIRLEFAPNDYFEDAVLEKKFWYKRDATATGDDLLPGGDLVSEPVRIQWKKGKDLTGGLLDMVIKVWEEKKQQQEQRAKEVGGSKSANKKEPSEAEKTLKKAIENTGIGGTSFFAWFGYIGYQPDDETDGSEAEKASDMDDDEDVDEDDDDDLEIFPNGDELAASIAEDLWPGAIKYFTQAQEQDALMDDEDEEDEEDED